MNHTSVVPPDAERTSRSMEARVAELEQQLQEQSELLDRALARLDASGSRPPANGTGEPNVGQSRRALLRGGALAIGAGIAGAAVVASPAAAADNGPVIIGAVNDGSLATDLRLGGSGALGHNVFTAQDSTFVGSSLPAAIGGYATGSRVGNGVYGYTDGNVASDTYSGYAFVAGCDSRGSSSRAQLFMFPSGPVPTADTISHQPGELVVSGDGRLWFCTAAGTPGTWEEFTGTGAAVAAAQSAADAAQTDVDALGASVDAIAPGPTFLPTSQRPFDSRPGEPGNGGSKGALAAGESRVVDLTVGTDFPAGAKAAIIHLTLAGSTSAGGFLSVYSAAVPNIARPGFSSLNWTSVGQIDANTTVTAVSPAGKIKIFALAGAHVAVDVIGYYA